MFEKSDAFFVVSNYNYDPSPLCLYAKDYVILDQSDDPEIIKYLRDDINLNIRFTPHVGHNLLDYFDWIIQNWDSLPPVIALVKGNVIGRHIDLEHWEQIYRNKHYTFIYNDRNIQNVRGIQYSAWSSDFNEVNNSWFAPLSHHRYFTNTNQLIEFLFESPKIPEFINFSPGACYIVESERVRKKPLSLFIGLREILNYEFFPSEAWMVERLLHMILFSEQRFKPYVYDEMKFLEEIRRLPDRTEEVFPKKSEIRKFVSKIEWKLRSYRK